MVTYKYTRSIRNDVFNYNDILANKSIEEWEAEEHHCECDSMYKEFKDQHHKHVITGNLNIIQNKSLRKIFQKGPNYRERNSINFSKARKEIEEGLANYAKKWSNKRGVVPETFNEWKVTVMKKVDRKIKELRKGPLKTWRRTSLILKDPKNIAELDKLKERFVIVPIDKANNNIGIVCKKYMIENILKEIKSNTYEDIGDVLTIVEEQTKKNIEAGWCINTENQKLPAIYATVKMHKKPIKFRYIIAAKQCVSKPIAQELTKILKLVLQVLRNYCEKIRQYTGVNRMWVTENTNDILKDITTVNFKRKARSIQTFDFSTLYTMIDQEDLKEKLKWAVDKAFAGGTNQWIKVDSNEAKFDRCKQGSTKKSYSKDDVHGMIDSIIDNAIFTFGKVAFRQVIGLPMGTDPAPFMANLYLFYYEFQYMKELTSTDFTTARRLFNHTRRFIDDLATINNKDHIQNNWMNIYPKELVLNKENCEDDKASFLDLDLAISKEGTIQTKIYDKRDAFNFDIVNYPDISGNIPEGAAYGVCIGQILRIAKNTSQLDDFIERSKLLIQKLKNKSYNPDILKKNVRKCITRHNEFFTKYDTDNDQLLMMIFD
jgi:hypothetical protein